MISRINSNKLVLITITLFLSGIFFKDSPNLYPRRGRKGLYHYETGMDAVGNLMQAGRNAARRKEEAEWKSEAEGAFGRVGSRLNAAEGEVHSHGARLDALEQMMGQRPQSIGSCSSSTTSTQPQVIIVIVFCIVL